MAVTAPDALKVTSDGLGIVAGVSGNNQLRDVRRLWQIAVTDPPPLAFDPDAAVKTGLKFEKLLPPELAFRAMAWRTYGEGVQ